MIWWQNGNYNALDDVLVRRRTQKLYVLVILSRRVLTSAIDDEASLADVLNRRNDIGSITLGC
ncbi:hypothetical protein CsSME_00004480 [Camellia sinensis var. sinensis]